MIAADTPAALESLDFSVVQYLESRLRATSGGWTPLARLARALRLGVLAGLQLRGQPVPRVTRPDIPLANRVYVVLRAAPGSSPGWTDKYELYLSAVRGASSRFHPSVISHAFSSQAEAEAFCIGAETGWPPLLQWQA